ncbi:MAG: succinate-semialdehyde dehydrogenase [Henriciella sp.]|jgi:succinate-semialdehyde dehydrogenase/glutarate-semialdehyde dehydrogenase|uniref:NAD-dependent succinate-semialdehyde dehydrogenase n=1 Tax=Henriciella sp. TaxID=1968823 RepID=UPI000C0E55BB|nr:NAD-dependent succinate-semialdehyde dehydrogenase [Henriciella sp.]MAN75450.1 succinate-semialdehyde dehydrogenase [Henriciella sp.]MBF34941.1 succinate-semialdehyde dehydrogenase [Hyphomonadaceae bacterium]PHR80515.1 MAG: succinate-semialdehyde dehydrogenase [Henriciella sp.]|tara:strand:- start:1846 stop:3243 length:1398 start_codon:yes stop_codon:yes gene_type:complete
MADSQRLSDMLITINPSNGEELERYPYMSDGDFNDTIEKCHEAFLEWRHETPEHRAEIIKKIGEGLKSKKTELTRMMTNEMGKVLKQGEAEMDLCIGICDWTAENGSKELRNEERELPNGGKGIITYSPIGVIYGIQPWNFPAYQVVRYAIANLMAGNGVLLKHAESVTGSGLMLEKIFRDAGLPENLFSVLRITHDQSDKVIDHKLVRGVTLTGSASAGQIIAKKAGEKLKKTVLELGSNDAYIVLDDADLENAVRQCVTGRVFNNGETCVAAKRFIVVDAIYDQFRDAFVKAMKDVKMGDPLNNEGDIGPMAREDLRDDLHEQVEKSVKNGAKVLCGGEKPSDAGWWYPATVLDEVKPGQPAYDDELFGPVAALIRAKDADDAMRIANDSRFGLGGGIFTGDNDRAIEMAEKYFDTGMVFINGFGLAQPNMPFGGVKDSGYGREHGGFGMKEFVNVKAINIMG